MSTSNSATREFGPLVSLPVLESPHSKASLASNEQSDPTKRAWDLFETKRRQRREVLLLTELEAMTDAEIAAALEIPLGTASRLRAARTACRAGLTREGAQGEGSS